MPFELHERIGPEPLAETSEQFMVPMGDKTRLATDVYLPDRPSKHSAVLVRTPYDKASRYTGLRFEAKYFTERGYAFVAQDVRGKFRSEGETLPYHYDVGDGYETVDWIVRQPWSNGRVGLMGASYYGYTVWAGVASGHPAIRAAVPQVTGVDMPDFHVGSRWTQMVPNLFGLNDLVQIWTDPSATLVTIDYGRRPLIDAFEEAAAVLGRSKAVDELLGRAKTREFYSPYGKRHPYYTTDIPILHWVSWFDPGLAPLGMRDWRRFRSLPGRRDLHFLRAHSEDHGGFLLSDVGAGDDRNPYLNDTTMAERLSVVTSDVMEFFDAHVDGRGAPAEPGRRARWHLGHVGWKETPDWPPRDVEESRLFLVASDQASGPAGALAATSAGDRRLIRWTHDPSQPVPSTTTIEEVWYFLAAYPDARSLQARTDVLTFTSDELAQPLDIAGQATAHLGVGSSGPSMHVFVGLQDVLPDGTTRPVVQGQIVNTAPDPERLIQIDLAEIAYRFHARHRLQVQVKSSDYPWYLVHPGTDQNPWFAEREVENEHILVTGGAVASHISLPILSGG
jgi:uncharacterized protein